MHGTLCLSFEARILLMFLQFSSYELLNFVVSVCGCQSWPVQSANAVCSSPAVFCSCPKGCEASKSQILKTLTTLGHFLGNNMHIQKLRFFETLIQCKIFISWYPLQKDILKFYREDYWKYILLPVMWIHLIWRSLRDSDNYLLPS